MSDLQRMTDPNVRARLAAVWTSGIPGDRNQADRRGGSFFPKHLARQVSRNRPNTPEKQSGPTTRKSLSHKGYAPPWNRTKNLLIKSTSLGLSRMKN